MVGIAVHFDDEPVAPRGHGGARHRRHLVALPRPVARVNQDRQVAELLDDGDRRDVERVARVALERADAALAQHHVHVAARQDVFRRQQPLFDRRGNAALEHDGHRRMPQLAQQREVLHVARADLEDVGIALHQFELADVHDLGHELEVVAVRRGLEEPQPFLAEPLEAVRAAARLERAAAQDLRAGPLHRRRGGLDLLFALGRAGPGHHDDLVAADPNVADRDHGVLGLERAARKLVRLGDPVHFLDAVQDFEQRRVELARPADRAEHGTERPARSMHVEAHFRQFRDDALHLRVARPFPHHNDHVSSLPSSIVLRRRSVPNAGLRR